MDSLDQKFNLKNLFNLTTIILLCLGCSWQIITIFQLYFSYPTNVFIETKFDAMERQFPAISFCNQHAHEYGKIFNSSDLVFDQYTIEEIVRVETVDFLDRPMINLTSYFVEKSIETASQQFYCLTLNSRLKGKKLPG